MNLKEFTEKELEILSNLLQDKIESSRKFLNNYAVERRKEHHQNEINTYELMRVKINNSLGKFGGE